MAGIGFELKKILARQSVMAKIGAVFYSVFATVGHILIIISVLMAVKLLLDRYGLMTFAEENLFSEIIVYSFAFPLIFSAGINAVLSRYIADKMWEKKTADVRASLRGVLLTYLALSAVPAVLFLAPAPGMSLALKLLSYVLYAHMGVIFVLMVYVTALKEYNQIAFSFAAGMGSIVLFSFIILRFFPAAPDLLTWLIGFFAFGTMIVIARLYFLIRAAFPQDSGAYFDFLLYIRKYPKLFIANTLYTVSLYVQNFVFWLYPGTQNSVSSFIYSGDFDLASAYALYTVMPAIVLFVVRTETGFFDVYRAFLEAVSRKTGREIEKARLAMRKKMWSEYLFCLEIQTLISVVLIVAGMKVLPMVGVSALTLELMPYLSLAILMMYFTFLACTLLQYFENYTDCLTAFTLHIVLNILFNTVFILMGPEFYGLGMAFATLPVLIFVLIRLKRTVDDIDFIIFCSSTLTPNQKTGRLEVLIKALNARRGEEKP